MTAREPSEFAGKVLLEEYQRLCVDIRSIESANEKILGLGFALIGLAATAGIYQEVDPIFFVLPIAVIGLIAYATVSYLCIYSMGGYKRHLEDLLNERIGERLLVWEQIVRYRERTSVSGHVLRFIYLVISVAIFALSILKLSEAYGLRVGLLMSALLLILTTAVLFGVRQMSTIFNRSYELAKRLRAEG
jgi:hypothetical protein